ncbi:MAG: hypothetical protein ACE5EB_01825 [Thermodesulfobacteriota bacterium]
MREFKGDKSERYRAAKLFHIAGLIIWLGPSAGGYFLILLAGVEGNVTVRLWLFGEYLFLIYIELVGLFMLLASGAVMISSSPGLKRARWLRLKLAVVSFVFIPLEAAQFFIYCNVIKRAFSKGIMLEEAARIFDRFSLVAFFILLTAIPLVFFLAVFRPRLFFRKD